ncbi:hypothetical protein [Halostella pelagica]|uniref:hypothetical protein n=1 Tax=Halostella pelagica TaxID=2583824 RepID=UPI00192A6691|nr:hypothetical protein [Halostella pelagica]
MGLKSGSRDAGLDESEDDSDGSNDAKSTETESIDKSETAAQEPDETPEETAPETSTETDTGAEPEDQRPTMDSLPYKIRRNKVNEGREQVPYFLREEIIEAETELQETLQDRLDETVYKSDYREASMVVAQRNPELVAEVLREWGYDLDTE